METAIKNYKVDNLEQLEKSFESALGRLLKKKDILLPLYDIYIMGNSISDEELRNSHGFRYGNREIAIREGFWDEVRECLVHGYDDIDIARVCNNDLILVKVFKELLNGKCFCYFLLNKPVSYKQVMKNTILSKAHSIYQEILNKPFSDCVDVAEWTKLANVKLNVLKNVEKVCGVAAPTKIAIAGEMRVTETASLLPKNKEVSQMSIDQIRDRIKALQGEIKDKKGIEESIPGELVERKA